MKWLLQPTLQRRVLLAMSLAFVLVWMALVIRGVYLGTNTEHRDKRIMVLSTLVLEQVSHFEDAAQASAFAGGVARLQNAIYRLDDVPTAMVLFLWDKQGKLVYASEESGYEALHASIANTSTATIQGRTYAVYRVESARWNLVIAQANLDTQWMSFAVAKSLVPDLLIAYVLAFPVLWLAVSRGLLPLREMSRRIATRGSDDLSAIGLLPKYGEMKPLQLALDGLFEKLRNKIARETAFVQEAAHELRTPMAVVSAQAHVLAMAQDDAGRLHAEQKLDRALARTSHLIGQLLQLAHLEGERDLDAAETDIAQEVRAELALLVPSARQRNIELSLQSPDALWGLLERETFKSILHNLVGNAIRYVEPGDKVVVSLAQHAGHMLLTVADNGPGIPPGQRDLVFERFHRGADHSAPGAGLGLAIVKQACMRLGGSVQVSDGLDNKGCQFVVRIPIVSKTIAG
jgi:two-component system sensor histidine kinase QseC